MPGRDGAGFIQQNGAQGLASFQRLAVAEEDARFRAPPRAHHDGGRRGQAQRAGAGDHEHGDHVEDRRRQVCAAAAANSEPAYKRDHGQRDDQWHEISRDAVGNRLNRRSAGLRRFHQPDDLPQDGVLADALRLGDQAPLLIDRAGDDLVAGFLVHRHALAAEHGLVNRGTAPGHNGVGRDALARLDQEQVARSDFVDGNRLLLAIAEQRGCSWRQPDQLLDGGAGPSLGSRFQQLAQRDQGQDDSGRFKIVGLADPVGKVEEQAQQDDQTIDISGQRAHRHQHVHVSAAVAQRLDRAAQVLPSQDENDRRRQRAEDEEPDVLRQECEVVHQERDLVQEVPRHAQDGQRDGEGGADQDQATLPLNFGLARGRLGILARPLAADFDDAVARLFHGFNEIAATDRPRHVADGCALIGQVDRDINHAVDFVERPRHILLAHGACHAGDGQVDAGSGHAIAGFFNLRNQIAHLELAGVIVDRRLLRRQVDRDIGDAVGALETALDILDAHGAGHTGNR